MREIWELIRHMWKHRWWTSEDDEGQPFCTLCNVRFTNEPPVFFGE